MAYGKQSRSREPAGCRTAALTSLCMRQNPVHASPLTRHMRTIVAVNRVTRPCSSGQSTHTTGRAGFCGGTEDTNISSRGQTHHRNHNLVQPQAERTSHAVRTRRVGGLTLVAARPSAASGSVMPGITASAPVKRFNAKEPRPENDSHTSTWPKTRAGGTRLPATVTPPSALRIRRSLASRVGAASAAEPCATKRRMWKARQCPAAAAIWVAPSRPRLRLPGGCALCRGGARC